MVSLGDVVIYTCEFDADLSETPNTSAALVVKVHPVTGLADLGVFVSNGYFFKANVPQGLPGIRGTWHVKL